MYRYIAGRLVQSLVSLFVVSVIVFALVRLSGDPIAIMAPAEATEKDIAALRAHLGLDRPWATQYWWFLTRALHGDFGQSIRFRRPAIDLVLERYGATLELGGLAVLVVIVIALPVGVYAAVWRGSRLDYVARTFAALGQAVPPFWLGLVLVLVFGVILHLLPTSGRGTPLHVLLPGITLGWFAVAGLMRLTRSAMLDVLGTEYVKLGADQGVARAAGDLEARLQERRAARGDLRGPGVRGAPERLDHHGDGVRLAGARPARHRGRRVARLSHRAGGGALSLRHVHRREPPGRYALRVLEPQDPLRVMSVPALAATGAVDAPRRDRRWPPSIPLAIVSILIVCALGAPVLAPRSPVEGSLGERLIAPIGNGGVEGRAPARHRPAWPRRR